MLGDGDKEAVRTRNAQPEFVSGRRRYVNVRDDIAPSSTKYSWMPFANAGDAGARCMYQALYRIANGSKNGEAARRACQHSTT